MSTRILTGDVRDVLATLPDESVQCVVTSPPYWGLRSYLPDDHRDKPREIGSEATMADHLAVMVGVFREVRRVLRQDGTCWLNYGDCYASDPKKGRATAEQSGKSAYLNGQPNQCRVPMGGVLKPKDLCMIPNRLAIALQDDGWWVRSEIIWAKPNPMPESVTDRPASSHEKIWLLTRSARYFYDAEAVRRPMTPGSIDRLSQDIDGQKVSDRAHAGGKTNGPMKAVGWRDGGARWTNEDQYQNKTEAGTANLRNVWTIPTKGFSGAHYATFPPDLIVPCIKAGTSEKGCCAECGAPWVRETEYRLEPTAKAAKRCVVDARDHAADKNDGGANRQKDGHLPGWKRSDITTGWSPSCACNADTIPCTVLDPFIGSGTTAMVADRLGRDCIGIDLNPANVEMATDRITADAGLFAEVAP